MSTQPQAASSRRRSSFGAQPTAPQPPKKKQRSSVGGVGTQETEVVCSNAREPPSSSAATSTLSSTGVRRRLVGLENGALLHIHLENFKSHANFSLDFGPRLNFIVGRNGTGKSSILAAIIAALGGNPSASAGLDPATSRLPALHAALSQSRLPAYC